ncbi:MAG: helix-hairpin-helix domain-containing protein [Chitinophagaceae bacterium]
MKNDDPWQEYFRFTRRERIAVLILLALIAGISVLPRVISETGEPISEVHDTSWMEVFRNLERSATQEKDSGSGKRNAFFRSGNNNLKKYDTPSTLFLFDPNTLSSEGWKRLGLRERTIRTIENYLRKGGRFRKPEDLEKIYGLFPEEFRRLAPFVKINGNNGVDSNYEKKTVRPFQNTDKRYERLDINLADSNTFISLPGIGQKLAARIVKFREKLGGFYSVDQVGETFGLPDSTFRRIKPMLDRGSTPVRRIFINTATEEELKTHPYIRYELARPIISYRGQNGPFRQPEDLKKVLALTGQELERLLPYLSFSTGE